MFAKPSFARLSMQNIHNENEAVILQTRFMGQLNRSELECQPLEELVCCFLLPLELPRVRELLHLVFFEREYQALGECFHVLACPVSAYGRQGVAVEQEKVFALLG